MSKQFEEKVLCWDTRKCFGKKHTGIFCGVLTKGYKGAKCPFCKPKAEVTGNRLYPYDENYGKH